METEIELRDLEQIQRRLEIEEPGEPAESDDENVLVQFANGCMSV